MSGAAISAHSRLQLFQRLHRLEGLLESLAGLLLGLGVVQRLRHLDIEFSIKCGILPQRDFLRKNCASHFGCHFLCHRTFSKLVSWPGPTTSQAPPAS